jgi:hypothetical protein
MKYLLIILTLVIISCAKQMHLYENTLMLPEEIHITFKTEREAKRVQKRLAKWCYMPVRKENVLYLDKKLIECNRKIFGNNYGFIREKYRSQIDKQLK